MSLEDFHPITAQWFAETLGEPTMAQRRGWAAIRDKRHTLIAAPTGSGKALAAFPDRPRRPVEGRAGRAARRRRPRRLCLAAEGAERRYPQEPGRAAPRPAPRCRGRGFGAPAITAAVRTGDTPQHERALMLRTPPHILVTTPESLYCCSPPNAAARCCAPHAVIVDEIHAVIGGRRGAHLALSLERLQSGQAAASAHRPVGNPEADR